MRRIHIWLFSILFLGMVLNSCGTQLSVAEKEQLAVEIRNAVETGNFVFRANFAQPTGYRSIHLSPTFDVRVSPDAIRSNLPFFGRAYRAPMSPSEAGYRFTSTNFEYSYQKGNRDGQWNVVIRILDMGRPVTYRFTIWENASASLSITDTDRQAISFTGELVFKVIRD